MSNKVKIAIVVSASLLLAVLLYFIIPNQTKQVKKKKEPTKELKGQKRNSQGTYMLYELLKDYESVVSLKTVQDPLDENLKTYNTNYPTVYFLVDNKLSLSQPAVDSLFDFVNRGGHAFISTGALNKNFYSYFFSKDPISNYRDTVYSLNFYHQDLALEKNYRLKVVENYFSLKHKWHYFKRDVSYYQKDLVEISTNTKWDQPIFIKFKLGKGWFYMHCVPEAFYNSSLFKKEGLAYTESVLADLPKGHYLWHEHSKKWDPFKDFTKRNSDNLNRKKESPLQYILANKSLRWAYILLMLSLLLYIIFQVKRKQQIIPTIQPNINQSLNFVDTVSKLYLRQGKHNKFIKHYQNSFLNYIKDKYFIPYPKTIDMKYVKLVALKSEIKEGDIEHILKEFKKARSKADFSADDLITLHKKVEDFYTNCK